ncbi:MAG: hypothetical protein LBL42_03080 [Tannerella sp.]|jgi:hypothetical protein|nr:hypothetical protein [Tannerella sp.]
MAIIDSVAIGSASKTAGDLTYKRVHGRTIASQKIMSNKSNTPAQNASRVAFKMLSNITKDASPMLKLTFFNVKYGTRRNNFIKSNKLLLTKIRDVLHGSYPLDIDGMSWLHTQLGDTIQRAVPVWGSGNVQMSGSIIAPSQADLQVDGMIAQPIEIGDQVNLFVFGFYDYDGGHYVILFNGTHVFEADDPLIGSNEFSLVSSDFPDLNIKFPAGASNVSLDFYANLTSNDLKSISSVIRQDLAMETKVSRTKSKDVEK